MLEPLLRGKRVRLTAIMEQDFTAIARWHDDSVFLRHLSADPALPRTPEQLKKKLDEHLNSSNGCCFAVRPNDETEELLGFVEVDGILWTHRTGWISLGFGQAGHRGRGFGSKRWSWRWDSPSGNSTCTGSS